MVYSCCLEYVAAVLNILCSPEAPGQWLSIARAAITYDRWPAMTYGHDRTLPKYNLSVDS